MAGDYYGYVYSDVFGWYAPWSQADPFRHLMPLPPLVNLSSGRASGTSTSRHHELVTNGPGGLRICGSGPGTSQLISPSSLTEEPS